MLVVSDDRSSIQQLDLRSRKLRTLTRADPRDITQIVRGGVTRASNGTFAAIVGGRLSGNSDPVVIYGPNGNVVRRIVVKLVNGGAVSAAYISPDGRRVAWLGQSQPGLFDTPMDRRIFIRLYVADVATGKVRSVNVATGPNMDHVPVVSGSCAWTRDGGLLLLTRGGLFRVGGLGGTPKLAKVHTLNLNHPESAAVSPDGRSVWFDQIRRGSAMRSLFAVDIRTGRVTQPLKGTGSLQHGDPMFSPDGKWVGFTQIYLMPYTRQLSYPVVSAYRSVGGSVDIRRSTPFVLGSTGRPVDSYGHPAWF